MKAIMKFLYFLIVLLFFLSISFAESIKEKVDVELVIVFDTSASINYSDLEKQRQYFYNAFKSKNVFESFQNNFYQTFLVSIIGYDSNVSIFVKEKFVRSEKDLNELANEILNMNLATGSVTDTEFGIEYAKTLIENNNVDSTVQHIDLISDGLFDNLSIGNINDANLNINCVMIEIDAMDMSLYAPVKEPKRIKIGPLSKCFDFTQKDIEILLINNFTIPLI